MTRALLWCVVWFLLLAPLPTGAQTGPSDEQFDQLTRRWHQTLDSVSRDLRDLTIVGDSLDALRENIWIVRESAEEARATAAAAAAQQQALLDALGPAPEEGAPPEDPGVAAERARIMELLSKDLGRVARANVVLARTEDLLARALDEETAALFGAIEENTVSPLMPGVAMAALAQFAERLDELGDEIARFGRTGTLFGSWSDAAVLLATIALTLLIVVPLRHWLLATYGPDPSVEQPGATRRFQAAAAVTFANAALPALVIAGLQTGLAQGPLVAPDLRLAASLLLATALEFVPLLGLVYAVVAPHHPRWRLSPLTDDAADRLYRAMRAYVVVLLVLAPSLVAISPVYAEGRFLQVAGLRTELSALGGFVGVVLLGLAMLNLMRGRNWRYRPDDPADRDAEEHGHAIARTVMVLVMAGVITSMVLCAIGYLNLGVFITRSMTRSLALLGYVIGLRILLEAGLRVATSAENRAGRWVRHRLLLDDAAAARLVFWLMLAVDLVGGALVLGALLVLWGLPAALLQQGADLAIEGVDVGGFRLSLVDIGLALGVLVALLAGVQVFKRFLSERVLVQTRLELGVRDALATGVSYVGYVLAALITFAVLGLDVSNIALIFGALSVGIGFGLQHVVSNFVSGLILLVQRPIKTGDWIVVGDQQGYVRRISVISTEIQTFDAAAVIIPNSTMLSNQVINWHLHNKLGRVIVAVGISYDCDPEEARRVLLACAAASPDVLKRPAPQVLFRDFGDSALLFELRFFLREIDDLLRVSSEMRFAIKKAFAEARIEIPYPQRDLHIRSNALAARSTASDDADETPVIEPAKVSKAT